MAEGTCYKVFGWSLDMILHEPRWKQLPRDLHVVELWCGVMSIVLAAREKGLKAEGYDINRIPGTTDVPKSKMSENIISQEGFENAVTLVMRCMGLLWMAPVCSSWIFCNMSNTKRNTGNVFGDTTYGPVRDGNLMANVAGFLLHLAWRRGLTAVIENPASSLIFRYPNLECILSFYNAHFCVTPRCSFSTEMLGERYYKLYKFAAIGPQTSSSPGAWIAKARRKCMCPGKQHIALMKKSCDGRITGQLDHLTKSAAYPKALGECIVQAWYSEVWAVTEPSGGSETGHTTLAAAMPSWLCPDEDADDDGGDVEVEKLKKSKMPTADKLLPDASWLQPTDDGTESLSDTDSLAAPTIQWGRPPSDDEGDLEEGMVSKTSAVSWLEPGDDDDELCHIPEPPCKSPPAKIARHSWHRPGF
jgi:hypothetical protein